MQVNKIYSIRNYQSQFFILYRITKCLEHYSQYQKIFGIFADKFHGQSNCTIRYMKLQNHIKRGGKMKYLIFGAGRHRIGALGGASTL